MRASGAALLNASAPAGIVSLELARTPAEATRIMVSWVRDGAIDAAITNVKLDYLFLLTYAPTIALACLLAMVSLEGRPRLASDNLFDRFPRPRLPLTPDFGERRPPEPVAERAERS